MQDAVAQARRLALAAVRAVYFGGDPSWTDMAAFDTPLEAQEEYTDEVARLLGDETPKFTDDGSALRACGRALWHDLSHTASSSMPCLDPESLQAIEAARQQLVFAFMPPADRQAMLDAMETAALVLYTISHAAA